MSRTNQIFVDQEKNRVEFLDSRFYQFPDGNFYPSATTILDAYPKDAFFFKWLKENGENADAMRDAAGDRGSIVHGLTEQYDEGQPVSILGEYGEVKYTIQEWAMFERYVQFKNKFPHAIQAVEMNFCSEKLKFGGTLDRKVLFGDYGKEFAIINNKNYLLDIKTGNSLYDHQWCQLAAYKKLYEEFVPEDPVEGIAILWLNAKTRTEGKKGQIQGAGWQLCLPEQPMEHYWELFKCTQKLWEEQNKNYKPKNFSYQIEYKP